jgi:hypothetical protein
MEKEHGHHHQRGVMMPSSPATDLVFAGATLLFASSTQETSTYRDGLKEGVTTIGAALTEEAVLSAP